MTTAGLDIYERLMLWKTYVGAQLAHKLPFLTASQVEGLQADVNGSLQLTLGATASQTALHIELNLQPLHVRQAVSIAKLYGRLQAADSNFQFGALHTILMAEHRHTHKMSKAQHLALASLHLEQHFPYIRQACLPEPVRMADLQILNHPRRPQSTLAPYRHNWELLVTKAAKDATRKEHLSWLQGTDHHGKTYWDLVPQADTHRTGLSKPSWMSLGLRPSNNSKLLLIRTMAVDLMRHSRFLDKSQQSVTREDAFCPLCFAGHQHGPVPEFPDDTFHALFACPRMQQERDILHSDIQSFLDQQPLYFTHEDTWHLCTWKTMPRNLRLEILMGGPLHKSKWSSPTHTIKTWQQTFLDYTTPRIWQLLQTKAHRGRVVPSGA
jgi:hypothetical protein